MANIYLTWPTDTMTRQLCCGNTIVYNWNRNYIYSYNIEKSQNNGV